jgi:hypothetical protein
LRGSHHARLALQGWLQWLRPGWTDPWPSGRTGRSGWQNRRLSHRDRNRSTRRDRSDRLIEAARRTGPVRDRDRHRHRKDANHHRWRGPLRDDGLVVVLVVVVPFRQEIDRCAGRRWRIADDGHDLLDLDDLDIGERRRQIFVDDFLEDGRRHARGREARQPAARIRGVGAARIAPQVRPIGLGGIAVQGPAPHHRLAPGRQDRFHAPCQTVVRVLAQELLILFDRIALDRDRIRLLG